MGKALVFNDIVVKGPLKQVTFVGETIPVAIKQYILKLSQPISKKKVTALTAFYNTLNEAGLWSQIRFLYPMYGSVDDCAHGLVGDDLMIPTGATYDKGLNLVNATGGKGPKGNGILIGSYDVSENLTVMSCLGKNVSGAVNSLTSTSLKDSNPSDLYCMRHYASATTCYYLHDKIETITGTGMANSCMMESVKIINTAVSATLKTYFNGTLVNTYDYTSGGVQTNSPDYCKWWIDGKATVPSNDGGLTMVGVFNKELTAEEVSLVYTSVVALQNVLFA